MSSGNGKFIKFETTIGNSIVAPDIWKTEDFGSRFVLRSPDNHVAIWLLTFTTEGSGPIQQFRDYVIGECISGDPVAWKSSEWSDILVGQDRSQMRDLVSSDPSNDSQWRLYVLQAGKYYHAIAINVSAETFMLNMELYHEIARSFIGVRE